MGSSDRDNNTGFQPTEPTLCVNDCGFFGAPATKGLCSKCYREILFHQENTVSAKSALEKIAGSAKQGPDEDDVVAAAEKAEILTAVVTVSSSEKEGEVKPTAAAQPSTSSVVVVKNRCFSCKKKVGLLGFDCRCGGTFCGVHRYAEKHGCTFDFKGFGREEIERANPVVKADKIEKI